MKLVLAAAFVAVLVAACGSDGDGGSGDSPQAEVAAIVIQAADDAGASPDADCIRQAADQLETSEAQALVDAGLDGDPDISVETGEILAEMLLC